VRGVRLVTPNAAEVATWAGRHGVRADEGLSPLARLTTLAGGLVTAWGSRALAVTRGESGALLSYGSGAPVVVPAPRAAGGDACGAGDRFAAAAAVALGSGMVTTEAVHAAVEAASAFVAGGGAGAFARDGRVPAEGAPDPGSGAASVISRVRAAGGVIVATGGCFDLLHAGHIATLRAARGLGDCLVVCLNSDDSVRRLKGRSRPLVPAEDRARVLRALSCVDAVAVFDEDTPEAVLRRLRPDIWAKGGDYAGTELPEASTLSSWGGQAVVLPYVQGRSTSALVQTAASSPPATTPKESHR
jgi:rfaE bifunctional protein nucleotidyltransferase chain/domain